MESLANMGRLIPTRGLASVYSNHVSMSEEQETNSLRNLRTGGGIQT